MSSTAGGGALYATEWSHVEVDGIEGSPLQALGVGGEWGWHGELWRLDAVPAPLRLEAAVGRAALRRVAARRAARVTQRGGPLPVLSRRRMPVLPLAEERLLRTGFVVTDGRRAWSVSYVPGRDGAALALFDRAVPPRGVPLWVVSAHHGSARAPTRALSGFVPGTPVETPRGPVPVERLRPGDAVLTDLGARPVRAVRLRPAAGAVALPAWLFGPTAPGAEVTVGHDTWLGVEGAALSELFGLGEALVRAGDLESLPVARSALRADLIALTLDGAPLVMAGGLPCLAGPAERSPMRRLGAGEAAIALGHAALWPSPRMVLRRAAA